MDLQAYLKHISPKWSLQWWKELGDRKEIGAVPQEATRKEIARALWHFYASTVRVSRLSKPLREPIDAGTPGMTVITDSRNAQHSKTRMIRTLPCSMISGTTKHPHALPRADWRLTWRETRQARSGQAPRAPDAAEKEVGRVGADTLRDGG